MNDASQFDHVRQELAAKPDGVLEAVAAAHGLSLLEVIECLPQESWKRISGEHFVEVVQDISDWRDITFIVHTKDVIAEFHGALPGGALGHGYYNLKGGGGLSGHLQATNATRSYFCSDRLWDWTPNQCNSSTVTARLCSRSSLVGMRAGG